MPLVRLTSSGHYPDFVVKVSDDELETLRRLNTKSYIFDAEEGRLLIAELRRREHEPDIPEFCIYA